MNVWGIFKQWIPLIFKISDEKIHTSQKWKIKKNLMLVTTTQMFQTVHLVRVYYTDMPAHYSTSDICKEICFKGGLKNSQCRRFFFFSVCSPKWSGKNAFVLLCPLCISCVLFYLYFLSFLSCVGILYTRACTQGKRADPVKWSAHPKHTIERAWGGGGRS